MIIPKSAVGHLRGFKGFHGFGNTPLFTSANVGSVTFTNDSAANDTITGPAPFGLGLTGNNPNEWHVVPATASDPSGLPNGEIWSGLGTQNLTTAKANITQADTEYNTNPSDALVTITQAFMTQAQGLVTSLDTDQPFGISGRSAAQDTQYFSDMQSLKSAIEDYNTTVAPLVTVEKQGVQAQVQNQVTADVQAQNAAQQSASLATQQAAAAAAAQAQQNAFQQAQAQIAAASGQSQAQVAPAPASDPTMTYLLIGGVALAGVAWFMLKD
jgi:hypothetical protein